MTSKLQTEKTEGSKEARKERKEKDPGDEKAVRRATLRVARWARERSTLLIVCAIVIIALEVFGFNHYFWSTLGNTPITDPVVVAQGGDSPVGGQYTASGGVTFDVYPGGDASTFVTVDSLDIAAHAVGKARVNMLNNADVDMDRSCDIYEAIVVYDEGHTTGYSPDAYTLKAQVDMAADGETVLDHMESTGDAADNSLFHRMCMVVPSTMRRSVHASGKVSRITVMLRRDAQSRDDSRDFVIDSIALNTRVPLRLNALRVFLLFAVAVSVACFFTRKNAMARACVAAAGEGEESAGGMDMTQTQKDQWLILMTAVMALTVLVQLQGTDNGPMYGYADLAQSLMAGRLDIPYGNAYPQLRELNNPYDYLSRATQMRNCPFDVAYFDGRIYIYFGVVPALLFYLPFRAATGIDLTDTGAMVIIDAILIVGAFLIMKELRRTIGARVPWNLYLLLTTTVAMAPTVCIMVKEASIYYVSLGCGVALVQMGLWLWLASLRDPAAGGGTGICLWRGMLGSLLMALAVGCRPTMALASFLAFVIYRRQFARIREKGMWWRFLLLVAPYVPVAAGIMWYNDARFGSPFQFGAVYQLTASNVSHMAASPSLLLYGLWYFLFDLPTFSVTFPYMYYRKPEFDYSGDIYVSNSIGGAFFLIPIFLLLLAPSVWRCCKCTAPLRGTALGLTVALIAVESLNGGFCVRYGMDFRYILAVAAAASALEWVDVAIGGGDEALLLRRYRILGALCIASLILSAMSAVTDFDDTVMWSDPAGNTVFWARLWDFFDLLKV